MVSYGNEARSYDENYRRWIGLVSRAFENLRRYLVMQNVTEQLEKIRSNKFADLRVVFESLSEGEKHDYLIVEKILEQNLFKYLFQPIVSTKDGSIYSYEALMRSNTEKFLPPLLINVIAWVAGTVVDMVAPFCSGASAKAVIHGTHRSSTASSITINFFIRKGHLLRASGETL